MNSSRVPWPRSPGSAVVVLGALCLAARLPGLRSMPIFGDEAIRLHWAFLFRENPVHFALVSMQAPVPPLHSWVLALFLPVSRDPVRSGRLVSVLFGVLTVPAFYLLVGELRSRLGRGLVADASRSAIGYWIAGLLLVSCPYLAFHQRVALAESLFVFEATVAAWLAVRLASDPGGQTALAFGVSMAAAMLTRQNLSYVLWILPPITIFLLGPRQRVRGWTFARYFAASFVIGLLLWLPAVLSAQRVGWFERLFHSRLLAAPMGPSARLRMAATNSADIVSWLWTYMTPPVLLFAVLALVGLWRSGEKRIVIFLVTWLGVALLPLVFFGRFLFSRYGVASAIPLLAAIGLFLDRLVFRKAAAVFVPLALAAWPAWDLVLQDCNWSRQALVSVDRWQFVTGWPAGSATEQAADFLRRRAETDRFVLLIPRNEGNPMDTLWIDFSASPSVRAFSVGDVLTEPLIRRGEIPGTVLLDDNPRRMKPSMDVTLAPGTPVFHVSPEPIYTRQGPMRALDLLTRFNPGLEEVARFWNPPAEALGCPTDGMVVFRVR